MNEYKKIERFPIEEWKALGTKLFGKDSKKWKFVCASCGNIQSVESMIKNNPKIEEESKTIWKVDLRNIVYFNCEGRYTDDIGCNWSLGGLFKIHKTEVLLPDGEFVPVFEFSQKQEE